MNKPNVLWVDDDPVFCKEMEESFGSKYHIHFVHDYENAANELTNDIYDLVVVDLHLETEMSGLKLVEEIKLRQPGLPVIVVSQGKYRELDEARLKGADDALYKAESDVERWQSIFQSFLDQISIFLSYSSQDQQFVRMLNERLIERGFITWLEEVEILPGDSILDGIHQGINASDFLIAILTQNSVSSKWVEREIKTAIRQNTDHSEKEVRRIRVIPIKLDECNLPPILNDDTSFADWSNLTDLIIRKKKEIEGYILDRRTNLPVIDKRWLHDEFAQKFDQHFRTLIKVLERR